MSPTPPPDVLSQAENIMVGIIHGIFIVLGILPNAVVFFTLLKDTQFMREPKNLIIFVRALADGLQSATVCPMPFVSSFAGRWTTGFTGCVVYAFVVSWLGLSSIQLNALMVYERWYALSQIPPRVMSTKTTYISIFACFAAGLLASFFPLIGWSGYGYEAFGYHCAVEWHGMDFNHASFTIFLMVFFYLLPVGIIMVTGVKISQSIKVLRRHVEETRGPDSPLNKVTYQVQIKATRIVGVMVLGFLVAWTPYGAFALYAMNHTGIPILTSGLPSMLAKSALVYNPLIYMFMSRKLRRKSVRTVQVFFDNLLATAVDIFGAFCKSESSSTLTTHRGRTSMVFPTSSILEEPTPSESESQPRRGAWVEHSQ